METKCYKYWANYNKKNLQEYREVPDERTQLLINVMTRYCDSSYFQWVHEFGCNVGRNLVAIRKTFFYLVTGNDINKRGLEIAKKENSLFVVDMPTQMLLSTMSPVDYIVTMAHLIHIPSSFDGILKEYIPKSFTKYFFCMEKSQKFVKDTDIGGPTFPRKYSTFFNDSLRLLESIPVEMRPKGYKLYVFERK